MKKMSVGKVVFGLAVTLGLSGAALVQAEGADAATLYRAYNPNTGEHLYTTNGNEIPSVVSAGWKNEGNAWEVPSKGTPIYRMFNPNNGGDHHYTPNQAEVNMLKAAGWRYEGVAWQSGGSIPVHRLYNPNAKTGTHHFTIDANEKDALVRAGWKYEGVTMYSGGDQTTSPSPSTPKATEPLGNSGILEKTESAALDKAEVMNNDSNSPWYGGYFYLTEKNPNKVWAFISKKVKMSNGETWYSVDFYVLEK